MSYLQSKVHSFNANLGNVAGKISNKRSVGAVAPSVKPAPSPTPSQASDTSKNDLKRKRPAPSDVVFSQPKDTGMGNEIGTQITYAIEFLKNKNTPQKLSDILSYLSLQTRDDAYKDLFRRIMIKHIKVNYKPSQGDSPSLFSFKPAHNIRSPETLLSHLQSQRTFEGLSVKELKDGWPEAEVEIDQLEAKGKLLVTRNMKDSHARMVWLDDPSLGFHIDEDFQSLWHKIKLPEASVLAAELESHGLQPANKTGVVKKPTKAHEKPKRKARAGGKTTNVHMAGVLKDYSHLKK
ncbi:MAG: hypothetical protein Q9212_003289 [Teloschistes hypoglaucus]